jgi:hypothetical protein
MLLRVLAFLVLSLAVAVSPVQAQQFTCTSNQLVGSDLTMIDAGVVGGRLGINVLAAKPFDSLAITTASQVDFFIDADQNPDTGDLRPGSIRGVDYRVSCLAGMITSCTLYALPADPYGPETVVNVPVASTLYANGYGLAISFPAPSTASDVFAFAHGRIGVFSGGSGNGDRCPEAGVFDTATGSVTVRAPAAVIDAVIDDGSGAALLGWRFQTFRDQFRLIAGFKAPVDIFSLNFQGRIELDTDRSLMTGLVHTPFVIPSPFNEIPSWGWDVAIAMQGGSQGGSDPIPFYLDFGNQSAYNQPPRSYAFPYGFPFGEKYNDGRWYVYQNNLILEGSLSMLDARAWAPTTVTRYPANGGVIGRIFTNINAQISDMIPKNGSAFDTAVNQIFPALQSVPAQTVSGPGSCGGDPHWDFSYADAEIAGDNLVVRGLLNRLDPSWRATHLALFLDSDNNKATGTVISLGAEPVGSDFTVFVSPRDLYAYIGYTVDLIRPDNSREGHDSWLNIRYSDPNQINSAAEVVLTVPLAALGHPTTPIRLYLGSIAIDNKGVPQLVCLAPSSQPLAIGGSSVPPEPPQPPQPPEPPQPPPPVQKTAPGAPTITSVHAGNGQATVSFTPPSSNGGTAITGYTVASTPAGGVDADAGSTALTHVVRGLTNGTAYTFIVTAANSVGPGAASAPSQPVIPSSIPDRRKKIIMPVLQMLMD